MSNAQVPVCFGRSWEANHPECAGGLDPLYTHPQRKDHRRDRCSWYSSCASRTTAARQQVNQQVQIIPVQQLVRQQPSQPPQQFQQPQQVMPPQYQAVVSGVSQGVQNAMVGAQYQVRPQQYMQQQQVQALPAQLMVHPSAASTPWAVPMNFQAPGSQMPAYLTVPEPIIPGQGTFRPLMHTILRSVLKAGCHSIANFYDHVPMGTYPAPAGNPYHP